MRFAPWQIVLVTLCISLLKCANASEVVASQWVVFDAQNTTTMYGNPAYNGPFGAPFIPDKLVKALYFGLRHVVAMTEDGVLFGWGKDQDLGGIALGGIQTMVPTPIFNTSIVVAAATSANATMVVTSEGELWFVGALYYPLYATSWTLLNPSGLISFLSVKCGYAHCIAQSDGGQLYGIGWNEAGQISSTAGSVVTSLIQLSGIDYIPNITSAMYCTGGKHTSILINRVLWQLGDCHAVSGDCLVPSLFPRFVNLTFSDTVTQVECGSYHTVVKSASKVYAIGANDVGQSNPAAPGLFSGLQEVPLLNFGPNRVIVVGNTTIGKNIFGYLTGFGLNNSMLIPPGILGGENFERPPWLRMLSVDEGSGSPLRYTFGVRFRESGTCEDPRPLSTAVCLPTLDPTKGRWAMQRPLQMAANRLFSILTLNRLMTVYGDFILNSNASIAFDWPEDPDSPPLEVEGCAQIEGQISLYISPDNIQDIKKNHKGKRTIKLIKSQCPFFSGNSKRDLSIILDQSLAMAPDDAPEYGTEPDPSIVPTDTAKGGTSSETLFLEPTAAPSSSSSSSCSKTSVSSEEESNSDGTTTLVAIVTVNSSSCDTWWIVLASVLGGLAVIVVVAAIVILSVPKIRAKVLPYHGSRT